MRHRNPMPLSHGPLRSIASPIQGVADGCIVPIAPERECVKVDRGIQVFSRYQLFTDDSFTVIRPDTPGFKTYRFMSTPADCRDCRYWNVEIWGNEVDQVATPAGGLVQQLQPSSIMSVGRQHSRMKIRLTYHASSGGTVRILDVGQGIRVGLSACMITVDALIPDVTSPVAAGGIPVAQQGTAVIGNTSGTLLPTIPAMTNGLLLNTLLGGYICEGYPPGDDSATNTITVRVLANTTIRTPVPPGTRRVTIYQTGIGDIATPEWLLFDDPAAPSLGQIALGANRRVVNLDRPGAAEVISSGPADDEIRVITYIFSLEL